MNSSDKLICVNNLKWIMYKHFSLLLLTLNVPFHISKCTTRGTCTPVWEPLFYSLLVTVAYVLSHATGAALLHTTWPTTVIIIFYLSPDTKSIVQTHTLCIIKVHKNRQNRKLYNGIGVGWITGLHVLSREFAWRSRQKYKITDTYLTLLFANLWH